MDGGVGRVSASGWRHEARIMALRRAFQRAASVIAVSDSTQHDVVNILDVPACKVQRMKGHLKRVASFY